MENLTSPSQNRPSPMTFTCLLSVEKLQSNRKFNQRSEKMQRRMKNSQAIQNYTLPLNNVQDLLEGYRQCSEPYPLNCSADSETLTRGKKVTVCCPQAHRPQTSWNQNVDGDSLLPYHQPVRRISMS